MPNNRSSGPAIARLSLFGRWSWHGRPLNSTLGPFNAMTNVLGALRSAAAILVLGLVLPCAASMRGVLAEDPKPEKLYLVKTIFVEPIGSWDKVTTIESRLQKAMESKGFRIVNERATADAIMKGVVGAEVVLDGGSEDTSKAVYEFQLLMSGEPIWKARVKFRSKPTFAEDDDHAALQLAEKLVRDSRKSAKRAGLR
jgi:hypothetical protein